MIVTRQKNRFIDLDLNFSKHPVTNDVSRVTDAKSVGRAIRNLVFTRMYESPFHPEISCQVTDLLFDQMDPATVNSIQKMIEYSIINFEPRVNLVAVNVFPDYGNRSIDVTVVYMIVGLAETYEISFNLSRVI